MLRWPRPRRPRRAPRPVGTARRAGPDSAAASDHAPSIIRRYGSAIVAGSSSVPPAFHSRYAIRPTTNGSPCSPPAIAIPRRASCWARSVSSAQINRSKTPAETSGLFLSVSSSARLKTACSSVARDHNISAAALYF